MAEIDKFASLLLDEAKRFFELACGTKDSVAQPAYLHAALMVGFCSLEAHVNAVAEEMSERKSLSPHEKAVLLEQAVRLEDGGFVRAGLRIHRLEDRVYFLHRRFGRTGFKKADAMSPQMKSAISLRNNLTHPKGVPTITIGAVKSALTAIIDTIDSLYKAIYGKSLPAASRGLQSKLGFSI